MATYKLKSGIQLCNAACTSRAALALALLAIFGLPGCDEVYRGTPATIIIGTAPLESSALIYVAEEKGFFNRNGLSADIRSYDTGAASLDGMLKQEVDIAVSAEYAIAGQVMSGAEVDMVACICKAQYFYLVGRRDRGINTIADLKGKRIGVVTKTIAEFYLSRFLELNGINPKDMVTVNISTSDAESALAGSSVDAIVARPPYYNNITAALGGNIVTWPAQSSEPLYAVLTGRSNWVNEHGPLLERLMKALAQAEDYTLQHPSEVKALVASQLALDQAYIENVWSENQFSLSLEQSLIIAMEDEARWMVQNGLSSIQALPDFADYVSAAALREIKPGAISVIN